MTDRKLNVYVNDTLMGVITEKTNIWTFQYEQSWVKTRGAFALCPDIPLIEKVQIDGSSKRPIQHFFDNLLPEENARILLAKDLGVKDKLDTFMLLEKSGKESAGALTITSEDILLPERSMAHLTYDELNSRIQNLPKSPLNNQNTKRMSLAGAQHKMLVIMQGDDICEPNLSMPSTHILKPKHSVPDEYWQTTMNEWFVMTLAKAVGLDVPPVRILYTPEPVYIIERFDRQGEFPEHQRVHIIDACQLLGVDKLAKYPMSTVETYKKVIEASRPKGKTIQRLYQWVLFNLLMGNGDAHLKNMSFYQVGDGSVLSPFYDLLSTAIYAPPHDTLNEGLSIAIGGKERFGDVEYADLVVFASEIGLPIKVMKKVTSTMVSKIEREFDALFDSVVKAPVNVQKAGEIRMLREIKYKVLIPILKNISTE
ncbi:HipA domain-containing protein [Colwellia sp. C1TZA3]|uniref:HipA domain-containing protein n=1 Tax=Colwellia sp. C1TZA3 TaxID=2508879 RepID=UPI0011BA3A5F|nr:HipA domain-containing protein [Colwellia sp. C1TZA3]TWX64220.1 type II toxin-antitoxin system HipA family toxin [Colwellia sp. C1TZA3]